MANNIVNPTNSPNIIIITDSSQNQISVTQSVTTLLEVGAVTGSISAVASYMLIS